MKDAPSRTLFSRRHALMATCAAGAAGVGSALVRQLGRDEPVPAEAAAACLLTPEVTAGPYHIDAATLRSNIVEDRKGTPLTLILGVQSAGTCRPVRGATVEIWHADAQGAYSGYDSGGATAGPGFGDLVSGLLGGSGPGAPQNPTSSTRYLRGAQRTNRRGQVAFHTIYPGWYQGRAPHIHVLVHVAGREVHTGQVFFAEAASGAIYRQGAYAPHGRASTTNADDSIFKGAGANRAIPAMQRSGAGYVGRLTMGVRV